MAEEIKDYTPELQKLFVETLISDPETYSRCQNILSHTYFEQPFMDCVQFIKKCIKTYKNYEQYTINTGLNYF